MCEPRPIAGPEGEGGVGAAPVRCPLRCHPRRWSPCRCQTRRPFQARAAEAQRPRRRCWLHRLSGRVCDGSASPSPRARVRSSAPPLYRDPELPPLTASQPGLTPEPNSLTTQLHAEASQRCSSCRRRQPPISPVALQAGAGKGSRALPSSPARAARSTRPSQSRLCAVALHGRPGPPAGRSTRSGITQGQFDSILRCLRISSSICVIYLRFTDVNQHVSTLQLVIDRSGDPLDQRALRAALPRARCLLVRLYSDNGLGYPDVWHSLCPRLSDLYILADARYVTIVFNELRHSQQSHE